MQRALNKTLPAPGWGGGDQSSFTFNPNAEITVNSNKDGRWFLDSPAEQVEVTPDSRGSVTIHNPFYWKYDNVTPGSLYGTNEKISTGGPVESSVTATFSVDKDGKVNVAPPLTTGTAGFPSTLGGSVDSVVQSSQDEGSINIKTVLTATTSTTQGRTNTSGTGGDVKPLGVGISASGSTADSWGTSTSGTGAWTATYGILFKVKRTPPVSVSAKINFNQEGKFVSGNDGIDGVNAWWGRIPRSVQAQIKLGKKTVWISGHASQTGDATRNQVVVANRLKDVTKKLLALTPGIQIVADNTGATAGERSVDIEVRYTESEASAPIL